MSLISFILPVHNEEATLPKLYEELIILRNNLKNYKVEFIFINDGSSDKSYQVLSDLHNQNPKEIKVINFSRNFGHQIAISAGHNMASGDAVVVMDTDLQDPPITVVEMVKRWEEGFDIVYAKRKSYKTNLIKKTLAFLFYRILNKIANINIPEDTGDFRLISKRVNDEIKKYKEKARFLRGISSLIGFKQTFVEFDRSQRFAGKPTYTFFKSLKLALDGITGFSLFPLRIITFFGFIFSVSSFVFGFIYILYTVVEKANISGWASLMAAVIFLGGIQLLMLGIIGEYLGRIYLQVLDRPLYTIDTLLGFESEEEKRV